MHNVLIVGIWPLKRKKKKTTRGRYKGEREKYFEKVNGMESLSMDAYV